MALREFEDSEGRVWRVWDIEPHPLAARPAPAGGARPRGARSAGDLNGGWLCFEGDAEKRRLAPVPRGWDEMEDGALERLMRGARAVHRRRP